MKLIMKKLIKPLITDFKKVNLYGDCVVTGKNSYFYPFLRRVLKVKIMGLFWIEW